METSLEALLSSEEMSIIGSLPDLFRFIQKNRIKSGDKKVGYYD